MRHLHNDHRSFKPGSSHFRTLFVRRAKWHAKAIEATINVSCFILYSCFVFFFQLRIESWSGAIVRAIDKQSVREVSSTKKQTCLVERESGCEINRIIIGGGNGDMTKGSTIKHMWVAIGGWWNLKNEATVSRNSENETITTYFGPS